MEQRYERFGYYYDLIYDTFINYALDCDLLEGIFEKFCALPPRTVLDIGCGTGTHAIEFARRGYRSTGIDLSPVMIAQAIRKAAHADVAVDFQVQDMRAMEFASRFDCAFCWFGGFGYLVNDDDLRRFFERLHQILYDHSLFIFEFWHVGGVRAGFKNWQKVTDHDEGCTLIRLSESNYDPTNGILDLFMDFYVFADPGREVKDRFAENHHLKCYTLDEMERTVTRNGFKLVAMYDRDRSTVEPIATSETTFRILAIATKDRRS